MTTNEGRRRDPVGVDHRGLGVLDLRDCLRRIASTPIGRIAFQDAGETIILPVNHVVDDTTIAFRTRWDSTLAAAIRDDSVGFEVDEYDAREHTGWSVLVRGIASKVYDEMTCLRFEELLGVPWEGPPEKNFWIRIRAEEVSGRELNISRGKCGCC